MSEESGESRAGQSAEPEEKKKSGNSRITTVYVPVLSLLIALASVLASAFMSAKSIDSAETISKFTESSQRLRHTMEERVRLIAELNAIFTQVPREISNLYDYDRIFNAVSLSYTDIITKALEIIGNEEERAIADSVMWICIQSSAELSPLGLAEPDDEAKIKLAAITLRSFKEFGKLAGELTVAAMKDYDAYLAGSQRASLVE